jgi:HlyD family secretion protein
MAPQTVESPSRLIQQSPKAETTPPRRKAILTRRRILVLVVGLLVLAVAVIAWKAFFAGGRLPPNLVTLSGRIEGDDSAVAAKVSGRILEARVREGDVVKAGDTIATLDDQQVRARKEQARAAVLQAEARARAARDQIAVLQEQWQQSQVQLEQAKVDAEGRVRQAEADLAAAEAELAQQEAAYQLAIFDKEAYTRLAQTGAASERQGRQAVTTAEQQGAAVAAGKRRVEAARGALTAAKANLSNPAIRSAQSAAIQKQIAQQQAEIASATAQLEQARAQLREAEANLEDLAVRAPFGGTVITRTAEPGEVVMAGTPIVTLLDLNKVYLRGFVPEGQIGRVRVGQPARIYLDSNPKQAVEAYVSRVDPEAMFTPENTYFREERVKQVVGVKLQLKDSMGFAKPGMPADGEILVEGNQWPTTNRSRW